MTDFAMKRTTLFAKSPGNEKFYDLDAKTLSSCGYSDWSIPGVAFECGVKEQSFVMAARASSEPITFGILFSNGFRMLFEAIVVDVKRRRKNARRGQEASLHFKAVICSEIHRFGSVA